MTDAHTQAVNEAELASTAEKIRRLDAAGSKETRLAYSILGPMLRDLPLMDSFLLSHEAVEAWVVLRDQEPEIFLTYLATVRQRCGRHVSDLIVNRVGPPRPVLSRDALPGYTVASIWEGFEAPRYLVKHLIGVGELAVLFGQSGHFKSVLAIDLALCVATETNFHGLRVGHKAGVLYVAGEGHAGLRKRLRAWLLSREMDSTTAQPALYMTSAGADLIGNPSQLRATVEHAAEVLGMPIELMVLDTLAANFGPGDEDRAIDMGRAIAGARDAACGAGVLLIHHTGHGNVERERGSYALIAAADYRLQASYDQASKLIELKWRKAKDDELPAPLYFRWNSIPLGWEDADGEELRSVVLERTEGDAGASEEPRERAGSAGLGANQETVLKALQRLYRQHRQHLQDSGRDPSEAKVTLISLRAVVIDGRRLDSKRYPEALAGLEKRGLVRVDAPFIFLVNEAT